jgi:hypothetical protein
MTVSIVDLVVRAAGAKPSRDEVVAACVAAAEGAQQLRGDGDLLQARGVLRRCADEACPALIRKDCTTWFVEVTEAIPSVIFTAQVGDQSVFDVSVSEAGKPLTEQLDGNPIEVNPGIHAFVFERAGLPTIEKRSIVAQHEKGKNLSVAWPSPRTEMAPNAPVAPPDTRAAPPNVPMATPNAYSALSPGRIVGWSAVGLAAAGVAVGSVAGILTFDEKSTARAACPNNVCRPGGVADVHQAQVDATVSTVGFAVGAAAALLGGYLVLRNEQQAQSAVRLTFGPKVALREAGAWLGVQFE